MKLVSKKSFPNRFIVCNYLVGGFLAYLFLCVLFGSKAAFSDELSSPQRIVVFPLYAEEILVDMVGSERIVYVGHRQIEDESYSPTVQHVSYISGASWQNCDENELLQLNPDLVVLDEDLMPDYTEIFPVLSQKEIKFFFVNEPESIDEIRSLITQIGDVVGESERAHEMVADFDSSLKEVAHFVDCKQTSASKTAAYVGEYFSLWDDIIEVTGLASLSSKCICHFDDVEVLTEWNPDIILFSPCVLDTDGSLLSSGQDYVQEVRGQISSNPKLTTITAVIEGNLYPLCIYSSHYVVNSIRDLLQYMYSDYLSFD